MHVKLLTKDRIQEYVLFQPVPQLPIPAKNLDTTGTNIASTTFGKSAIALFFKVATINMFAVVSITMHLLEPDRLGDCAVKPLQVVK